jgi:cellulose synthase/poly-beta-1,6-N-acetylglucosamine synthase-like glycosyltransferase
MQIVAWLTFILGGAFIFYALVGYPILLWMFARWRSLPVHKRYEPLTVTVLLPVHNGAQWLRDKLLSILSLDYPRDRMQVLVISDGSTDNTDQIAQQFASEGVELERLPKGGKARAINRGVELATGEILFFTDVRQRLAPDCLKKLVGCFSDKQVGGVCGELVILDGETQEEASVGLYWTIEKWIRRQLSAVGTLLVVTGCLYAIRRDLAEPVPEGALGDDIFVPQAVLRKGYRVIFEDGAKAYDYPTTHDVEFRRKIRTLAGLYQYVFRHGFGRYWFHFISYKVSRVLLPYALIAVAVASFFLPTPFAYVAIGGQVFFYGLAAIDRWIPEGTLLKRISSPPRTFCMLMAASIRAVSVFFVPASDLWKTTQVRTPKSSS